MTHRRAFLSCRVYVNIRLDGKMVSTDETEAKEEGRERESGKIEEKRELPGQEKLELNCTMFGNGVQ